MSKRGENIYRRKDGRWEARYKKGRSGGRMERSATDTVTEKHIGKRRKKVFGHRQRQETLRDSAGPAVWWLITVMNGFV